MLQKLAPLEFQGLHEQLERMWERLSGGLPNQPRFCPAILEPPIDVYETSDTVVVVVEMAGIQDEEVDLLFEQGQLTLRGKREDRHGKGLIRRYLQMEICRGSFRRTIPMPTAVDPDRAQAAYRDGLLEIILPKAEASGGRSVRIRALP